MAKKYAKKLKNEQDIFEWARKRAEGMDPNLARKYFEATQPKLFIEEMASLNLTEHAQTRTIESILARAGVSGTWPGDINDDFKEQDFINYMEDFYLPRAKFFHEQSTNWFVMRMRASDPNLFEELYNRGANWENISYEGNQGTKTVYSIPIYGGVVTVLFDPSEVTFTLV